ncbi:M23 family metallopeptidase [Treponema putidum]|uniref:M23 family metallopeptidase n=1 Tax=Treponema putidum TaxID=221027 RepID=A0AAE9MTI6_9SPIR|nr:M23 family metallopeptidase [Treponema putidum]AIN94553.1 peptigoglycan-binding protein LysM [Treponema putidum]TWI78849.1 LysM domain-containing protein [Treponema putidum]UTY28562.1 M23 family metallopeptidase [Treponema putidum]UTY31010.1 M23 family metallopeptidase [Treponema putidum]UTY33427.1 M23 family metallopeptidase [Treponema putidum]
MYKKNILRLIFFIFFLFSGFAEDIVHTIEKGDTLYALSKKYNTPIDSILKKNNLTDPSKIKVGQKIIIPVEDSAKTNAKTNSEEITHVIQKGDTLYALAKKFGVKFSDILKLNGINEKTPLKIGQILKIPQGKSQSSTKEQKNHSAQADKQEKTSVTKVESDKETQAVKPSTSAKQADSKLLWPVPASKVAYLSGKITGVVIDSVKGQAVKAVSSGKVVSTGPHRGFGQVVFVQSKTKHIYVYGGMEKVIVKKGDTIAVGQKLGELGVELLTGKARLYFMVYDKNKPIDPAKAPRGL